MQVFSASRAARLAGYRTTYMLDYLKRAGIVLPSHRPNPGRGRRRLYTYGDLVVLKAVQHLLAQGISVRKLRQALTVARRAFKSIEPHSVIHRFMVINGQNIYLKDEASAVVDLTGGGQYAFAFVVDIMRVRNDLDEQLRLEAS